MRLSPIKAFYSKSSFATFKNDKHFSKTYANNLHSFDKVTFSGEYSPSFLRNKILLNNIIVSDLSSKNGVILEVKDNFVNSIASKISSFDTPILISISGESGCGKTTLVETIKKYSKDNDIPITFIQTDSYFRDISDKIKEVGSFDNLLKTGFDLDSPDNFYLDELKSDVLSLKSGNFVSGRKYLLNGTGISKKNTINYEPNRIIVLEGTMANNSKIKELSDVSIYVETPEDVRFERYLSRAKSRNQKNDDAKLQFEYVKNAGKKYVVPDKNNCDIVLSGEFNRDRIVDILNELFSLRAR